MISISSDHLILAIILFTAARRWANGDPLAKRTPKPIFVPFGFAAGFCATLVAIPFTVNWSYPLHEHLQIFESEIKPASLLTKVVYVPLLEEAFFREIILRNLAARIAFWPALLSVSLLFGLLHFYSIERILFASALGLLMGYVYLRYGFWAAVATHSGVNLSGTLIPYLILSMQLRGI
ncbi:MAG: CPBP family intramembrane glutamic endopeptidase [Meiothermus sp.]|uniref:CPBP family intramembrane glutamic endopeptidase n=1 Tax=Meiothermus sp. TaxID=1955249 RepID=UPI00298F176D|nr:CPBP family intramembrane glutamic endopeptidase [Meiothermus sp.]MDW8482300.1 CPBP family intramembrane glutamic endopeptidase [Meiothermus sp.]